MQAKQAMKTHVPNYTGAFALSIVLLWLLRRYFGPFPEDVGEALHALIVLGSTFTIHRLRTVIDKRLVKTAASALVFFTVSNAEASSAKSVIFERTETVWEPKLDAHGLPVMENGEELGFEVEQKIPEVFLDLSVSLDFFVIDWATREYVLGVSPGIGYGLKWAPEFWKLSPVFLAVDLFVQAGVFESNPDLDGPDEFNIDVLPAVIIGDWVGVGFGPRFKVSLHKESKNQIAGIFSFGMRKSL